MERVLSRFAGSIYAGLRVIAGFMFACHGAQKLLGMFGGPPGEMPVPLLWIAGSIELVGGLLVAIGLFTSWAAFLASGMMAVAYFIAHQPQGALPIQNHGELAVLYCWAFLLIAVRGAGPMSVDAARGATSPA